MRQTDTALHVESICTNLAVLRRPNAKDEIFRLWPIHDNKETLASIMGAYWRPANQIYAIDADEQRALYELRWLERRAPSANIVWGILEYLDRHWDVPGQIDAMQVFISNTRIEIMRDVMPDFGEMYQHTTGVWSYAPYIAAGMQHYRTDFQRSIAVMCGSEAEQSSVLRTMDALGYAFVGGYTWGQRSAVRLRLSPLYLTHNSAEYDYALQLWEYMRHNNTITLLHAKGNTINQRSRFIPLTVYKGAIIRIEHLLYPYCQFLEWSNRNDLWLRRGRFAPVTDTPFFYEDLGEKISDAVFGGALPIQIQWSMSATRLHSEA